MSLHSISSPMTLKNVEHRGVTRASAISTRTTSAVKAPDPANSRVSQRLKSTGSDLDKRQLRKFLLEQHPEGITALIEVPRFEFCKSIGCGAGRSSLRRPDPAQDGNDHRRKARQHCVARFIDRRPVEPVAQQCQAGCDRSVFV